MKTLHDFHLLRQRVLHLIDETPEAQHVLLRPAVAPRRTMRRRIARAASWFTLFAAGVALQPAAFAAGAVVQHTLAAAYDIVDDYF